MAEMILLKNNANTVFGNTSFEVTISGANVAIMTLKGYTGQKIWSLPVKPGSNGSFRVAKSANDTFESTETVTCSTY
jgi:hypothetical protein